MAKRVAGAVLPVVHVHGGHAALGRAMGAAQAPYIRHVVHALLENLREQKIDERLVREHNAPYVDAAERIFPQLVLELREMASAANVPFELLFRLNCYEARPPEERARERERAQAAAVAPASAAEPEVPVKDPGEMRTPVEAAGGEAGDNCTSVVSDGPGGMVVGHTEDSSPEAVEGLYLLDATIDEPHGATGAARSRFLALNYGQTLPGCAAAVNEHGLIVLIDALPDPDRRVGAPRHFVSRALLDLPDIDAAIDFLGATERGGGWNYLLVQGHRAVNVEATATRATAIEVQRGGAYAHSNHYLTPEFAAAAGEPRPNSLVRLNRALDLVRPGMDMTQMKQMLGDRQGFPDSICRDRTIGALVADTARRRLDVCWGEPDGATWSTYSY